MGGNTMLTIDRYSFICIDESCLRLARPNELNDQKKKIIVAGRMYRDNQANGIHTIDVKKYEKTYIQGKDNLIYYLGRKSIDMLKYEKAMNENIPIITKFQIGYCYSKEDIGKHLPCIVGRVGLEKEERKVFIEKQNFEESIVTDLDGIDYFIDWFGMRSEQYKKLLTERKNFPAKMQKSFGIFGERSLKVNMIELNDYIPILGTAGAHVIK